MALLISVLVNGAIMGGVYALMAMGLNTQFGVARILNIAHGEFIVLAAFITYSLATTGGMHPLLGMLVAGPIVFGIGYALHITIFRFSKKQNESAFEGNAILIAFGLYFVVQSSMQQAIGSRYTSLPFMLYSVKVGDADIAAGNLVVLLVAAVICVVYNIFMSQTRTGKSLRAAAQDPQAAALVGVKINHVMALCFAIGGLLAAFAGVLICMKDSFSATAGLNYTTIAIIIVVLGGLGSVKGAILGGFIMGIVGYAISAYIDTGLMMSVFYLVILVLLIVRPKGLLGR
ncbi:MAG: branched-chain amino acid ABC transporter permease [Clostridiales bacterium]|nr:branched-chain amino acid ABC transporter permease [Clostridiales bacterium]